MDDFLKNVTPGVFSGVASGLVLALFFGGGNFIHKYRERKDQVQYLSDLIVQFRTRILDTKEDLFVAEINQTLTRENVRKTYYDDLRRQLESALAGRCSRLTYDEIQQVNATFVWLHKLYPKFVPTEKWYIDTFQKAESINWLRLPPTTRTPKSK